MCIREDGSFNIEYDDGDKEFKVSVTRIRLEGAIVAKQIYFAVSVSTIISASTIISYHIISYHIMSDLFAYLCRGLLILILFSI